MSTDRDQIATELRKVWETSTLWPTRAMSAAALRSIKIDLNYLVKKLLYGFNPERLKMLPHLRSLHENPSLPLTRQVVRRHIRSRLPWREQDPADRKNREKSTNGYERRAVSALFGDSQETGYLNLEARRDLAGSFESPPVGHHSVRRRGGLQDQVVNLLAAKLWADELTKLLNNRKLAYDQAKEYYRGMWGDQGRVYATDKSGTVFMPLFNRAP